MLRNLRILAEQCCARFPLGALCTLVVTICLAVTSQRSLAQGTQPSDTTVSFVTVYPGTDIYELEGHSALRITTPTSDVAISYGIFDFNQPNFVYRFVKGETDYMVGMIPWSLFVREYLDEGRRVIEQKLDMPPGSKAKIIELVRTNLLPQNRTYRYNYVLDNCATRPLRTVELALGDSIMLGQPAPGTNFDTFRNYMRHYHTNYPWYQFGIDLALGSGIDRPIDNREKSFAPVVLAAQLDSATVNRRSLVCDTSVVLDIAPENAVTGPTPFLLTPLFWCWVLALVTLLVVARLLRRNARYPRLFATIIFVVYGLAGCLLTFLIFVSVHEATSPNWNYLWLNPLCFLPAITLWIQRAARLTLWYMIANSGALIVMFTIWCTGVQSPNPAFVPLVLADLTLSAGYIAHRKLIDR